jgi:hypothetical protein
MKFGMRWMGVLALATVLFGCAAPVPMKADAREAIHSVAVVSLVPEPAPLLSLGLTVFNNDEGVLPLSPRTVIEGAAGDRLAQAHPGWLVKPVRYDPASLAKRARPGFAEWPSATYIQEELAALAREAGVDAILVFVPMSYNPDDTGGLGVGVWMRNLPFLHYAIVHANIGLEVVDAHGKVVAQARERDPLEVARVRADRENIKLEWPLQPAAQERFASILRVETGDNVRIRMAEVGL